MSRSRRVPASVPSLMYGSLPTWGTYAENSSLPFSSANSSGEEPSSPSKMSLTMCVPASVPSLVHSSMPVCGSEPTARKNSRSPTRKRSQMLEPAGPATMSEIRTVPAVVPSLVHTSRPASGSWALKNSLSSDAVRYAR